MHGDRMIPADVERLLQPLWEHYGTQGWTVYPNRIQPIHRDLAQILRRAGVELPVGMNLDWEPRPLAGKWYGHIILGEDRIEVDRQFAAWNKARLAKEPTIPDDERLTQEEAEALQRPMDYYDFDQMVQRVEERGKNT